MIVDCGGTCYNEVTRPTHEIMHFHSIIDEWSQFYCDDSKNESCAVLVNINGVDSIDIQSLYYPLTNTP